MCSNLRTQVNKLEKQNKEAEAEENNNYTDFVNRDNNINLHNENAENELDWLNNSSVIAPSRDVNNFNQISFNEGLNQYNNLNNNRIGENNFTSSPKVVKKDKLHLQVEKLKQKKNELFHYNCNEEKDDLKNLLTIKRLDVSPRFIPSAINNKPKNESSTKEQIIQNLHSLKEKERAENSSRSPDEILNSQKDKIDNKENLKSKLLKRQGKGNKLIKNEN